MSPFILISFVWLCGSATGVVENDAIPCFNRLSGSPGDQVITTICATVTYDKNWFSYTWKDAEEQCQDNGGHLISITNDWENNAIYVALQDASLSNCWIGLLDIGCLNGYWAWIDGEDYKYKNWQSGEPTDTTDCCTKMNGYIRYGYGSEAWETARCSSGLHCFICGSITNIEVITTTSSTATTATSTTSIATNTSTISSTTTTNSTTLTTTTPITANSTTLMLGNTSVPFPTSAPTMPSTVITTSQIGKGMTHTDNNNLISTGGDIALIILASIFFLTTVGLDILIQRPKWIQFFKHSKISHTKKTNDGVTGVSNDVYGGATAPTTNVSTIYYDTQNETARIQDSKTDHPDPHQRDLDVERKLMTNNFVNNELYG